METAATQPKERLRHLAGYLGRLGTLEKLLIGSVVIILGMSFFLVSQYASGGSSVAAVVIPDDADRARAMMFLRASGIPATTNATGEVLVSPEQASMARGLLMEEQVVPIQTASLFERLVEGRSWMNSRQDNHQQYWALYQDELSKSLTAWRSLRQARVMINMPEQAGLGRAHRSPTASVMVWPAAGALPQDSVDAVAIAVGNAVSGLEPQDVSVVAGNSGLAYFPRTDSRLDARGTLEHRAQVEAMLEDKIREFLRDIPGMSLAVLARVDHARSSTQRQQFERPVSGLASETVSNLNQQNAAQGGAPGTRSNESMSINQGSATGSSTTESTEETTFENRFGSSAENIEDPGGDIEGVSVMLGVPRSHISRLIEQEREPPAEGEEALPAPSPADIAQRFDSLRGDMERRIQLALGNIVSGDPADVAVTVSMLSDVAMTGTPGQAGGLGLGGGLGGGTGLLGLTGGGIIDTAVLGVLAVVSLAMMALLVRKATRRVELPSAEDLVGIPPALQVDGDLYGEADEGDVPMSGIELDEEQVRSSKMLEQVGELVNSSPEAAATLLQSWISASEE